MPALALKVHFYKSLSKIDPSRETRLMDFLARHNFKTVSDPLPENHFLIHANREMCHMDLREVAPHGYDRSGMKTMAAGRRLFYVDNGAISADQPAWRTWSYFHLRRFASFLGWPLPRRLTFAVFSSGPCGDLDWQELSAPDSLSYPIGL